MAGSGGPPGAFRRLFIIVLIPLFAAAAVAVYTLGIPWPRPVPFDVGRVSKLEPRAVTLARGIHLLGGLSPSAAYAIETSRGLVLVDCGLAADAAPLRAQLRELGLDVRRLKAILLTHAHGDHSGGADALRAATGARVYAGADDVPPLSAGGPRTAFFSNFYMPGVALHATRVDVELKGGEALDFGDVRIRALGTPGHTPGSTCYLLERDGLRALFAGDVIMKLRGDVPPRGELSNPLGTYSAYLPPSYRGDARLMRDSVRMLRDLPVPDLVLPGHPRSDPKPESPCLTAARWAELLDAGIREMDLLLARYESDGRDFLDGGPRTILPGLDYLGDHQGVAVYLLERAGKRILVNAPGPTGLVEFVRERGGGPGRRIDAVLLTSTDPGGAAGLKAAVEAWRPRVLVAREGLDAARAACPAGTEVTAADSWPALAIETLPLSGRGAAPAAYHLAWGNKAVLFTPRIPVKATGAAIYELFEEFLAGHAQPDAYVLSTERLARLRPDIWLPAVPVDGQNANVYDDEWARVVAQNREAIRSNLPMLSKKAGR